jgi:hypothetical protein
MVLINHKRPDAVPRIIIGVGECIVTRLRSEENIVMKRLASMLCFALAVMHAESVHATDRQATAIEGTYLLIQDDGFQRVLSFDRGGNVSQVSDQQTLIGFTEGLGAWEQTSPNNVGARVVDFAFDLKSGRRLGSSLIIYELTFTDLEAGQYQRVGGSYSGKVFPVGENPLEPTKQPIQSFGVSFKGRRISFE